MRSDYVSVSLAALAALTMCAVPLLGVQGAESALILGVLLPPFAAYSCAQISRRCQQQRTALHTLLGRSLGHAALLWALPALILSLDALRVRNCTPLEGLFFMLLGPGFGLLLASLTGSALALALPHAFALPLLAAGIPLLTMLATIVRFYTGPGIFAYGHYFGFFPGTLYDEGVTITAPLLWLRVVTALLCAGLALGIVSGTGPDLRWRLVPERGRGLAFVTALLCLALALIAQVFSDELGHSTSTRHVRNALGATVSSARCEIHLPREWPARERRRLREDCDFRVQQAEHWLGLTHPEKIHVYLFRSPAEKYALMGAEGTNIAKPWRSEVYISEVGWPNPTLGHELMHVVARSAGRGPFRIAGGFGGLWPNPALIEGVAVAAAWQSQGGLTPHEWAHAMLELKMIPKLSELFGPSFLGQQHRLAYTLSGSLLRFVHERWGRAAVARTYAAGDLERGVGVPLSQIEQAFRAYLLAQPLSPDALALARARFSGGGIFSAVCPHALAKLRDALHADLNAGDDPSAQKTCARILAVDAHDASTRVALASLLARRGDRAGAQRMQQALARDGAPAPFLAAIRQALADQAFREGKPNEAAALYRALLAEPIDDDQRRMLQVKALACEAAAEGGSGRTQSELLFELLVGNPGERIEGTSAVYLTRQLRALRDDGLAPYLEARQLFFQSRFEYAAGLLEMALQRGLPTRELRTEALRVLAVSRLGLGQLDAAAARFADYADGGSPARRAEAADFLARIAFLRRRGAR